MAQPRQDDDDLPKPVATRLHKPSWKDGRLVAGVMLVIVATIGGALTLQHLNSSVERLVAVHALVPGQHVTKGDVKVVQVRVPRGDDHYLSAADALPSGVVLRVVRPGELVPRSAIGGAAALDCKTVALPVSTAQSADLVVGSVVDIWVSRRDTHSTRSDAFKKPEQLIEGATVARVPHTSDSGLSVSTGEVSVHVLVPDDKVASVLAAVNGGAKVNLVPAAGSLLKDPA